MALLLTEVKHLKQLVRNIIDPTRDLGHVDRHKKDINPKPEIEPNKLFNDSSEKIGGVEKPQVREEREREGNACEDCA